MSTPPPDGQTVFVINPNSTQRVTDGIDAAMAPLRMAGGPAIECLSLPSGPPGIQSQHDVESVTLPLAALARSLEARAGAFVIACFSDPGLFAVREAVKAPVLGIMECGILSALTLGQRFGVIAILDASIPRHLRAYGAMGVQSRLAGELAIGLNVTELSQYQRTLQRMTEVGRRLRDERGSDVIVMGCAGMAVYREPLQQALGMPVVEPSQAAVAMAIGRVKLNWHGA
ncbi:MULTISPECIES: aspartate/glutamate racemase family protein [unclassified Herbaspirillum]|uniref:aspartate/glutamate racemase family protein n=1 Tax=unclassified Herbaspirillum TaxID=2624150 RepID=UPI001150A34C|nr:MULTISPECIES: aspartate/glutamate racemase family protein [unclassified Herbaspirillum]MBB5391835.1 Asp/Glu/hydantoin racemase [Herbaspirillum sp. SJZ102]TQK02921.1 Asp/Glu/hydantoin racemase [Herbaspirillum sp. SJZ130]TQK06691.1 Asp/Glu/hydantoin racemase [Herbaspirillum sp. SJZ106]